MKTFFRLFIGLVILTASASVLVAQTNDTYWTPSFAPLDNRGKMKRLNEIEPRSMIDRVPFTISQSGSYYLISNLVADASITNGIVIDADDVTLDLNGFVLAGTTNAWRGITMTTNNHRNITIRNGVVRGWGEAGLFLLNGVNCSLSGVTAMENGSGPAYAAIYVGQDWDVDDCTAFMNLNTGISIGNNSRARNCKSRGNRMYGFSTGEGGRLENCSAVGNAGDGFSGGAFTMILNCIAIGNTNNGIVVGNFAIASGNIAGQNGVDGIVAGMGSRVEKNVAADNQRRGITAGATSRVTDNQVTSNRGTGIYGYWASRVDNNHLFGNGVGIESDSYANGSLFVGNTAVGNMTNYITTPTANFAQIVGIESLMPNTNFWFNDPLANFSLQH